MNIEEIKTKCERAKREEFQERVYDSAAYYLITSDIPALIAEVKRLTAENQGLRANSMIQEHIISGGRGPIKDGEIMRLIMDNAAKDQQIATLKKALEYACADRATTPSMWQDLQKKYMEIAHQAQEQEGKK